MTDKNLKIHVRSGNRRIDAEPGRSLMEALIKENIFLRSDCGGKGTCRKCRIEVIEPDGSVEIREACRLTLTDDIAIHIPRVSMLSPHIISKAPILLPAGFEKKFEKLKGRDRFGVAVDLGTTTIAVYLCNMAKGRILSSLAVKNPQVLYGDDVMSRIGAAGQNAGKLKDIQELVVRAIEWGIKKVAASFDIEQTMISQVLIAGNPTMIHLLAGVDPSPLGVSPYQPVFSEAKKIGSGKLGFQLGDCSIQTLPQVSGFIGGDILSAAVAADLRSKPEGTLLIDLGTNGELMLKAKDGFYATSCATGPAFEGASVSCGMQALPGAVNNVRIQTFNASPAYTCINPTNASAEKPSGICGTGVISAVAQFLHTGIILPDGAFVRDVELPGLKTDSAGRLRYVIVPEGQSGQGRSVFISQKDIRSVQLGKSALITGIELLLKYANIQRPERILVAGAFGSFLDINDMITLGMIPAVDSTKVEAIGNAAGAGAVMALCDDFYFKESLQMAGEIRVVDLASDPDFQDRFIENLIFPM